MEENVYPKELKYTKTHEWVRKEVDTSVIGVTYYAARELGDVVFVELPKVGRNLLKDESFGTIEAVKAVSELYSPVSGEVIEVNLDLQSSPELVNKDCYGNGWMIKVKMKEPSELDTLLSSDEYEKILKSEGH